MRAKLARRLAAEWPRRLAFLRDAAHVDKEITTLVLHPDNQHCPDALWSAAPQWSGLTTRRLCHGHQIPLVSQHIMPRDPTQPWSLAHHSKAHRSAPKDATSRIRVSLCSGVQKAFFLLEPGVVCAM